MIVKTSINDLYFASELLYDSEVRRGDTPEAHASRRVADWLRYVAEQREEYEARKRSERPRYPSLKTGMQVVWAAKRAAA